jgi:hypothetical protein
VKKLLAMLVLLTPFAATAAVCDTTELEEIEQRYLGTAPDCIASGDYSSAVCGGVRQAHDDSTLEIAQLRASGCDYSGYKQDPLVEQQNKLVDSLPNKSAIKAKALSLKYDGTKACTDLIVDITREYDISKLRLVNVGGHPSEVQPTVNCAYTAVTTTVYGDRHVTIIALFNLTNNRYNIEIN